MLGCWGILGILGDMNMIVLTYHVNIIYISFKLDPCSVTVFDKTSASGAPRTLRANRGTPLARASEMPPQRVHHPEQEMKQ